MDKFKTKKSLGQNFLNDQNIINKIIDVANVEDYNVVEVGPGQGAITKPLLDSAKKVLSIEIDQRLIEYLEDEFSEYDNFKLLNEDFLKTTKEDFTYLNDAPVKMVANLPYYITTPIIIKTLIEYDFIEELYVMVQKEVALRFTSEYKNKSYSSITVFLQSIAQLSYEFTVKRTVFTPPPNVDSAIISFKRKQFNEVIDINEYEIFLQAAFKQKRKLLSNNLSKEFSINKDVIINFLKDLGYKKTIRPEEIKVEQYIDLFKDFKKKFKPD